MKNPERMLSFLKSKLGVLDFVFLVSALVIAASMVLLIVHYYPHNHGTSVLFFTVSFAINFLIVTILGICGRKIYHPIHLVALILALLVCWGCDHFSILLTYEEWTSRGMPAWGDCNARD